MIEFLESRTLLSAAVQMGDAAEAVFSKGHPLAVTDADGTQTLFALSGAGLGTVRRTTDGIDLLLTGTKSASKVTAKSVGGDGLFVIGSLSVDGAVGTLQLPRADLTGALTTGVYVGSLSLHRIDHAGTVPLVRGMDFGTIKLASTSRVDLYVDSVQSLRLQGDLLDSSLRFKATTDKKANGIKSLVVSGSIERTHIDALADIGSVTANAMRDSTVMAGVRYEYISPGVFEQTLPVATIGDDKSFTGTYKIGSVTIKGDRAAEFAFENSRIGAYAVGTVTLKQVNPDNSNKEFGVAGFYVRQVTARYPKGIDGTSTDLKIRQSYKPMKTKVLKPTAAAGGGVSYSAKIKTDGGGSSIDAVPIISVTPPIVNIVDVPLTGLELGRIAGLDGDVRIYLQPGKEEYYDPKKDQYLFNYRWTYEARRGDKVLSTDYYSVSAVVKRYVLIKDVSVKWIINPDKSASFFSTLSGPEVILSPVDEHAYYVVREEGTTLDQAKAALTSSRGDIWNATGFGAIHLSNAENIARAIQWVDSFERDPVKTQVERLYKRPVLYPKEPVLIGQRYALGQVLDIYYSTLDHHYRLISTLGEVVAEGSSVDVLLKPGDTYVDSRRRLNPVRFTLLSGDDVIQGLPDGGSIVFYKSDDIYITEAGKLVKTDYGTLVTNLDGTRWYYIDRAFENMGAKLR